MVARSGVLSLVLMGLLPMAARASEAMLAPSPALACLTLTPGQSDKLEYPEKLLARKDGGSVPVELVFHAPDEAPRVKVLDDSTFKGLIDAVKEHVSYYRVPCMRPGDAPVTLRQTYVFEPNDGRKVMASSPVDAADAARREQLRCMTNAKQGTEIDYPRNLIQMNVQGNFLVRLRFSTADQPAAVEWLTAGGHPVLRDLVEEYVAGLRVPCLKDGVIVAELAYMFRIDGGARTTLKDMTLQQVLGAVSDVPLPAYFDFNTMACPFDVRVNYYRPYKPNSVYELEQSHPARKPFLDWLSKATLRLSEKQNLAVLGDTLTVSVPCGKLDL